MAWISFPFRVPRTEAAAGAGEVRFPGGAAPVAFRSLAQISSPPWWYGVAGVIVAVIGVSAVGLALVPWQQSVSGAGRVIVFSPMDRPQTVEAMIPGRIAEWRVVDGQMVEEGNIIALLDDIDSKFLSPELVPQALRQREALEAQRKAAEQRAVKLKEQLSYMALAREAALPIAGERADKADDLVTAAEETLEQSRRSRDAIRDTQIPAAEERLEVAEENRLAQEEALRAAKQRLETEKLRRERVQQLFEKRLRSQQDDEFAQRDLVVAQTEVARAERALAAAVRQVNVAKLEVGRTRIDLARAESEVANRQAAVEAAKRDSNVGVIDLDQVDASTAAQLSSLEASIASAQETVAKADESIAKLDQDLQNFKLRTEQQTVKAPRGGRIVRLAKVGAGATVKAGDVLAVIAPTSTDSAVELYVSDNDAPLVDPGRPVRLQFAGWPAVQVSGYPSVAVGTFGGVVASVDPVDDGYGRFRVLVRPDHPRIGAGLDEPWPPLDRLRPGAKTVGWVMLDQVSMGFELWRRFNAFPPTIKNPALQPLVPPAEAGTGEGKGGGKKDPDSGEAK